MPLTTPIPPAPASAVEALRSAKPKNLAQWRTTLTAYLTACNVPTSQHAALLNAPKTMVQFEEVRRGLLTAAAAPSQKVITAAPRAATVPTLKANATDPELLAHFRALSPGPERNAFGITHADRLKAAVSAEFSATVIPARATDADLLAIYEKMPVGTARSAFSERHWQRLQAADKARRRSNSTAISPAAKN